MSAANGAPRLEDELEDLHRARDDFLRAEQEVNAFSKRHDRLPSEGECPAFGEMVEAADLLIGALNYVEQADPDAIVRYGGVRQRADEVLVLAAGGAGVCALTQRPRHELTDVGNGKRFAEDHAGNVRSVPGLGWIDYDGRRWRRDDDGAAVERGKTSAAGIREEARNLEDGDLAKKVFAHAVRSESRPRIEAMLKMAESERSLIARVEELDSDPFALNVLNGTLDLRTGELRPHRREDLITKLAPVVFDPDALCLRWLAFLEEVLDRDHELIAWLQRAVGYSLTGDTREQCMVITEGPGANGKSTFLETVASLAGEYGATADASTFMAARAGSTRTDLARLRGRRFVRAAEVEDDARFAEVLVKQLTGGDTVTARFLYRDEFEFTPAFKLWIAANSLPEIRGTDHAIWRRIRRIPFTHKVERPDKTLPAKLRDELPGILNWALEGCLAWQRDGLRVPDSVRAATQEYRRDQDSVRLFVDDGCSVEGQAASTPGRLRDAYTAFCAREGIEPVTPAAFGASLSSLGFTRARSNGLRLWRGIEPTQGRRDAE